MAYTFDVVQNWIEAVAVFDVPCLHLALLFGYVSRSDFSEDRKLKREPNECPSI